MSSQRLSPERTTLSDAPGNVTRQPSPRPVAAVRRCSNCNVEDRAETIEGEYDAFGQPKVEHHVTVELRYLKVQTEAEAQTRLTPHMRRRGWKYKLFQGRHAMERFVCRPCLRDLSIMERDWAKKGSGDTASNKDSYYGALCE